MNVINAIAWVKCTVVIRILIFDKAWTRNDSWHYIPLYESNLRVFFFFILEKYAKSVDPKNGKVLIEKWQFFKSDSEIVGLIQL